MLMEKKVHPLKMPNPLELRGCSQRVSASPAFLLHFLNPVLGLRTYRISEKSSFPVDVIVQSLLALGPALAYSLYLHRLWVPPCFSSEEMILSPNLIRKTD